MKSKKVKVRKIRFSTKEIKKSVGYIFKEPKVGENFIIFKHPFGEEILLSTNCIKDIIRTTDSYYIDTEDFRYTVTETS